MRSIGRNVGFAPLLGLFACAVGLACSGSTSTANTSQQEDDLRGAALVSCEKYCDKLTAACDMSGYASLDACFSAECYQVALTPAICLPIEKHYYDCGLGLGANVCPGAFANADCHAFQTTIDNCLQGKGTMQCTQAMPAGGCMAPRDDQCFQQTSAYECDTLRGTWRCPDGTVPVAEYDCSKVKLCKTPEPSGGCTDSTEGTCYHDPTGYQCDLTTGNWKCPAGTSPKPDHYSCATTGGSGGSHP